MKIDIYFLVTSCASWAAVSREGENLYVDSGQSNVHEDSIVYREEPENGWALKNEEAFELEIPEGIKYIEFRSGILVVIQPGGLAEAYDEDGLISIVNI